MPWPCPLELPSCGAEDVGEQRVVRLNFRFLSSRYDRNDSKPKQASTITTHEMKIPEKRVVKKW